LFRTIADRNIWVVYAATLLLGIGYGIAIASIGVFLDAQGHDKEDIGSLATAFALGIVLFSLPMGAVIRRFGAKPVLTVSLALYAVTISLFPVVASSFWGVAGVRFLDGAASAGIWVSSETILLSRARVEVKALVMSLYTIAVSIGYVIGPVISGILARYVPIEMTYYVSGGMSLLSAALVLVALGRGGRAELEVPVAGASAVDALPVDPHAARPGAASTASIFWRIKNSCFASFAYGYFQSSVVLFIPLWLSDERGIATDRTLLVTAYFAAGMLLCANLMARIGDRHGHLLTMRTQAAVGTVFLVLLPFVYQYWIICGFIFVAGATFATISPVSLALQGVSVAPEDYARSNSLYNAFYALGMLCGPPISSAFFRAISGDAMFWHLAVLWGAFVLFTLVYRKDDPHVRGLVVRASSAPAAS
jgi:MFS family permease